MKHFLMALLLFFVSPTYAADEYLNVTITDLAMGWSGEGVYVWVAEEVENSSCDRNVFKMNADAALFDQNYAMLLAAYIANHKVGLYVDGCSGTNINLKAVRLRKEN